MVGSLRQFYYFNTQLILLLNILLLTIRQIVKFSFFQNQILSLNDDSSQIIKESLQNEQIEIEKLQVSHQIRRVLLTQHQNEHIFNLNSITDQSINHNNLSIEVSFVYIKKKSLKEKQKIQKKKIIKQIENPRKLETIKSMVLTTNQKAQLNKDIIQYLLNNDYKKTATVFAEQIDLNIDDIDPDGKKLQIKWKSILSLQKKISTLQQKCLSLEDELAKGGGPGPNKNINIAELYLPKTPAKYAMTGHKATVTSLAFHPQYTQLATSSQDGSIKIWQFQTGDFQRTLKGHTNPVNCVNYDNKGNYLVSSSSDLSIKLWDLNNDYVCCKTFVGHDHNVSFVNFVFDGDYLISCSRDKTIKLWEISTGFNTRTYHGHEKWVRNVVMSSDNKIMASCSDDQSVCIWQVDKQTPINRYFAHDNVIETLLLVEGEQSQQLKNSQFLKSKFTQQSKINALKKLGEQGLNGISSYQQTFLFTGGRDKTIKLFICQTGEHLATFVGHDNWVRSITIHPTGKYLYSASDDKSIRIWDLNFGKEKKKIDNAHDHFISSIRFNKKYGVIATTGNDMKVKIWHLK